MFEKFTDRSRKIMRWAREEAERFNSEFIGTEHILMGLIREDGGSASDVLKKLKVDLKTVRQQVEKMIAPPPEQAPVYKGHMPFSPRAKHVLELAAEESVADRSHQIGTEHLLLALIKENEGIAAQVLINMGFTLAAIRQAILHETGAAQPVNPLHDLAESTKETLADAEGIFLDNLRLAYNRGRDDERERLKKVFQELTNSTEIKTGLEVLKKAIDEIEKGLA